MTRENNNEQMEFPDTWEEFEEYYGFYDTEEVYTNNSRLIPSFRVKQWLEHQMTVEEYRKRMMQAFHNADRGELIAVCVLPTEKEFEHLEWLLKNHYKKEPCGDAISRQEVLETLDKSKYSNEFCEEHHIDWSINLGMAHIVVNELKPVTPQPKMGRWISLGTKGEIDGQIVRTFTCSECGAISIFRVTSGNIVNGDLCPNCGAKMQEVKDENKRV